ncbi:LamG domain-containing protein [Flaviaesturariibacter amylovorans]|uniref:LamG-like jellyroll fold domain-containing protein n=1 Tax=Flaviaesturariibacter amylovorans TaxID=1084520 RepID=A0ABP8H0A0_9BACT
MKRITISKGSFALVAALGLAFGSCQKMERPALGDYPRDTNPPGGPLKFYAAMDGSSVDSIRATYGDDKNVTYSTGIKGQAYKGSATSYIVYPSANDFTQSGSFSVSFWMKKTPHAANAEFVFALPTTNNIWHKSEMFMLIEDQNQTTTSLTATKFMIKDQWFEFVGANRIPNLTNGQWHHLVLVYDQTTSKLTYYVDGAALTGLSANQTDVRSGGQPRGAIGWSNASKFVIGGPSHHGLNATPDGWMANYSGELDQFRLYGKALTAAEVTELFANKK